MPSPFSKMISRSTVLKLNRMRQREVECPTCSAEIGTQCEGASGKQRMRNHISRIKLAAGLK